MNKQLSLLLCFSIYFANTFSNDINTQLSMILSPNNKQIVATTNPVIVGLIIKNNGKPKKNQVVTIYIDGTPYANVATDKQGLFTYKVRSDKPLTNGEHFVFAVTQDNNKTYIRGSIFTVQARNRETYKSGNVDSSTSYIAYPFTGAAAATSTPYIVTLVFDSNNNQVPGENMTYKIDSTVVATNRTSDAYGMASYTLTAGQALLDGTHTVDAHAQESNVDLVQQTFIVDTTPPAAPVITSPTQNEIVNSSTVIITGTSDAYAAIIVYFNGGDGDWTGADGFGNWSIEYDNLANGSYSFNAQQIDEANNIGALSDNIDFTIST